jgi:hypothetical protein
MAVNEQHRQVEITVELDEAARLLAHPARDVPNLSRPPSSSRRRQSNSTGWAKRCAQRTPPTALSAG